MSSGFVRDPSRSWQCSEHPTWDCRVRPRILLAVRLDLFFSNFSSKQTTPDIEDIDNVSLGSTANPTRSELGLGICHGTRLRTKVVSTFYDYSSEHELTLAYQPAASMQRPCQLSRGRNIFLVLVR